jgi:hypothetical protein
LANVLVVVGEGCGVEVIVGKPQQTEGESVGRLWINLEEGLWQKLW